MKVRDQYTLRKEDWKIIFPPNSEKGSDSDDVSRPTIGNSALTFAFSRTFADQFCFTGQLYLKTFAELSSFWLPKRSSSREGAQKTTFSGEFSWSHKPARKIKESITVIKTIVIQKFDLRADICDSILT
ncbi:hypothetical protein CDAR_518201 [Caerostris darwini]|uniref:Uncharacterized protein n=1 Tax=Caerostris darwini TaxID=1538125 RepID=A0AAV4RMR3_9ARAC|nr:hypothetical protein CDAR_518201 [Caerostris darwini]